METEKIFDQLIDQFYQPLYRFALSLARAEADACDLVQQTFYLWATKGHQLRDPSKARMWLFTTLHREFLNRRRRVVRFPHQNLEEVEDDLPPLESEASLRVDAKGALVALGELDETFRAPVALFFLEDYSYQEIAAVLGIPLGTVKSRLSRGLRQLHARMQAPNPAEPSTPSSTCP